MSHMNLIIWGLSGCVHFQKPPPPKKKKNLKLNQTSIIRHWKTLIKNRVFQPLLRSCQGLEIQRYVFNITFETSISVKMVDTSSVRFSTDLTKTVWEYICNSRFSTLLLGRFTGSMFSPCPSKPPFSLYKIDLAQHKYECLIDSPKISIRQYRQRPEASQTGTSSYA